LNDDSKGNTDHYQAENIYDQLDFLYNTIAPCGILSLFCCIVKMHLKSMPKHHCNRNGNQYLEDGGVVVALCDANYTLDKVINSVYSVHACKQFHAKFNVNAAAALSCFFCVFVLFWHLKLFF